jgi:hypothetical protein
MGQIKIILGGGKKGREEEGKNKGKEHIFLKAGFKTGCCNVQTQTKGALLMYILYACV